MVTQTLLQQATSFPCFGTTERAGLVPATPSQATPIHQSDRVEIADIDGNGLPDILLPTYFFLQQPNGDFLTTDPPHYSSANVWDTTTGDFDNDGDIDLAMAAEDGVTCWTNDGTGSFVLTGEHFSGSFVYRVAAGDVDGDGDLDLVGSRGVLVNDGMGSFMFQNQQGGGAEQLVDMNGDGLIDVVSPGSVAMNDGQGGFLSRADYWRPMLNDSAVADMNRDGRPDLLSNGPMVMLNQGQLCQGP